MNNLVPGGYGPWFCAFIVNTAVRPKKYTHVVAHTMPHLVVDALNRNVVDSSGGGGNAKKRSRDDENQDCWIMVFKIGPFTHWSDSVMFLNQWLCKTRGKIHRMERGLELFAAYREQFHLCLWTQTRKRDEALDYFWNQQPLVIIPPPPASPAAAATSLTLDNTTTTPTKEQQQQEFKAWLEETRSFFANPEKMTLGTIRARIN